MNPEINDKIAMTYIEVEQLSKSTSYFAPFQSSLDMRSRILVYILNQAEDGLEEHSWTSTDVHAICPSKHGYDFAYIDARIKLFLWLICDEYDWISLMLKVGKDDFIDLLDELKRLPGPVLLPSSRIYIDALLEDAVKVSELAGEYIKNNNTHHC